jgi:carbamoyltransferase
MYDRMAADIEAGKITSWCQGRSEFGPRALGNRSILADPRRADMKDILNSRVKFRESFRPFTPSVLAERAQDYFELPIESPFMLMAAYVKPGMGDVVPAITHADNTARVQTVTRDVNERYYDLIKAFDRRTGVGLVLDTSFNVAGEPIVETPGDAIRCFMSTDIDVLCLDRFIITKKKALTV